MNSRPLLRLWLLIARIGSLTYVSSIDGLRMVYSNDESGAQTGRGSTDGSNGVEVRSNLDTDDYDDNEWEAPITADRKYLELLSITIREDPIESRLGVDPAISPGVERRRLGEPSFETSVGDDVGRLLAATSAGGGSQHSGSRQQIERILVKSDGDPFKNAETWTDVFAQQDKPLESLAPQDEASATTTKMTSILSRIAAFFSGNRAQTDDDGYEEEKQSEDTEEGVHEVGDEPEDNPDDEISNGLDGVEDDNGNFTLDGDDSTARRCFKHPQCLGMLNAFDPFKLPWGMAGHIYPDRPRTDPDFTEESATLPEMRSCLLEKNTECRAEHAGRICYTLQTKFFASKLINAMRGISNKCLHFLVKKQAPAPGNRYAYVEKLGGRTVTMAEFGSIDLCAHFCQRFPDTRHVLSLPMALDITLP